MDVVRGSTYTRREVTDSADLVSARVEAAWTLEFPSNQTETSSAVPSSTDTNKIIGLAKTRVSGPWLRRGPDLPATVNVTG